MIQVTLYTKSNCSLCDSLKADLLALQPEIGFLLLERDIEQTHVGDSESSQSDDRCTLFNQDETDRMSQYRNLLPVLDIEHGAVLYSPFSYDELFDALDEACSAASRAAAA